MNVKAYISSGIVESYVMGMATDAERAEFEAICAQYPEVAQARIEFELALEKELLNDAAVPPAFLKQAINDKIKGLGVAEHTGAAMAEAEGKTPVRRINAWKWVAAASIILLAGAFYWALDANRKYENLLASQKENAAQLEEATARLQAMQQDAELLHKPMRMAALTGGAGPGVYATIYWDTTSKDVYLMVNNLPQPANNKQYQLWALLEGKPIDLGMIEANQKRLLYRMKNVQQAEAFAITLEEKGGSSVPTSAPVVLSKL